VKTEARELQVERVSPPKNLRAAEREKAPMEWPASLMQTCCPVVEYSSKPSPVLLALLERLYIGCY
jgi:hypothetical protein